MENSELDKIKSAALLADMFLPANMGKVAEIAKQFLKLMELYVKKYEGTTADILDLKEEGLKEIALLLSNLSLLNKYKKGKLSNGQEAFFLSINPYLHESNDFLYERYVKGYNKERQERIEKLKLIFERQGQKVNSRVTKICVVKGTFFQKLKTIEGVRKRAKSKGLLMPNRIMAPDILQWFSLKTLRKMDFEQIIVMHKIFQKDSEYFASIFREDCGASSYVYIEPLSVDLVLRYILNKPYSTGFAFIAPEEEI